MDFKLNSFEELDRFIPLDERTSSEIHQPAHSPIVMQHLSAHFSKKHRAGKTVTVIKGFECSDHQIEEIARMIKKTMSVGGSVKNREIIIQGNDRSKIIQILSKQGHRVKKVGG